ncbi:DUF4974 domain-containing protein [Mucilaginibacter sp. S1162]|uniref:DUF4974 domain-containing protein n=1 Tax=Mucilaginibacter humi TaxID=2732510 RepID=A0ABX1W091_9SPHI|nr:DUF4974 domain-containing protein [Mucilaginibacter humi]NNU33269.1 DUF4974 domain-containing protein [Mucilaginibacter humi]
MRKIARWYDVQVSYKDEALKNETFAAVSTGFTNVSGLLKMLEQTGVAKFTIEDNKIIITRKNKRTDHPKNQLLPNQSKL